MVTREVDEILKKLQKTAEKTSPCWCLTREVSEEDGNKILWSIVGLYANRLEDSCLFDLCSDDEALILLNWFIAKGYTWDFDLDLQFSLLLLKRGFLVQERMEKIIKSYDWASYASPHQFLSFLPNMPNSEKWVLKLADQVPEDARDGFFMACLNMKSETIDRKLMAKFEEWYSSPGKAMDGTGEHGWLGAFIKKWINIYPYETLRDVIQIFFRNY